MATSKRQRFFAAFGAVLFFVTASALTVAVVIDMVSGNSDNTNTNITASEASDASTCTTSASVSTTAKYTVPDVYKPTGDVTELQTTDLEEGDGATVENGDCLQVKYYGTLASDGTKFDDNYGTNTLFQFELGAGQVISGWDAGLVGMKEGGTRRLVIPSELAYGENGGGSIPANADLVFVVKLINIEN